jgi:DNA-binding NarL/FixJ family response regulator
MRILIADDQHRVRFALRVLLERQPGLTVVGEAANKEELLSQAIACQPDVTLLGWELPGKAQVDLLADLRRICPQSAIIALSSRLEARRLALEAGVDAFVSKSDPPERLMTALHRYGDPPGEDGPQSATVKA